MTENSSMSRPNRDIPVVVHYTLGLVTLLLSACQGASPRTCDQPDGRRIEVGAAFALGCNCCLCRPDGTVICSGAGCADAGEGGLCQSDSDCPRGEVCAFNPGCDKSVGYCFGTHFCPGNGLQPYCGCDGKTFTVGASDWPAHPYRHLGACGGGS
jgi:hypothetical protein